MRSCLCNVSELNMLGLAIGENLGQRQLYNGVRSSGPSPLRHLCPLRPPTRNLREHAQRILLADARDAWFAAHQPITFVIWTRHWQQRWHPDLSEHWWTPSTTSWPPYPDSHLCIPTRHPEERHPPTEVLCQTAGGTMCPMCNARFPS